jgi:nucleotide-binding universal stress UspA family protein
MPNVMLVIPPGVVPQRARDQAIEAARALGGGVVALVVLDPAETARVAASLDSAFMGDQVSDRVVEVLTREARSRAEELLAALREPVVSAGLSFVGRVEEGDIGEVCAHAVRTHDVAVAIVVAERRSWLSRLLSGAADVRLPALPGCELRVLEEDS